MEPWYFGMSSAGRQYMEVLEGRGDGAAPPGGPAAVWLAVFFKVWLFSDLWPHQRVSLCSHRPRGFPHPLTSAHTWGGRDNLFPLLIQRLLVYISELLQFSCVLDGSTSLWPTGSASVLHLLAGRSCAGAVSLWSSGGSREPFWSWLGALGWLQPLELLSETGGGGGGGASTDGWEGPLDWMDSGLTWFVRSNWTPSTGWLELWPAIPDREIKSD